MKTNKAIILFAVVFSLFTANYCISQNTFEIDSLKMLLEQSSGIEKANLLKQIGGNYQQDEHYHKAITYYEKALEICSECNDTLLYAAVLKKIGTSYYYLCNYDKALENYLEALKLYEQINNQTGILEILNCIGNAYSRCYTYDKALEYYLKSYKISEQTGNKKGLYTVLNNIGVMYLLNIKDYDKALKYFYKSLLLSKKNNDSSKISILIQNIALVYFNMQKYDTALYYYFEALNLKNKFKNKLGIARATSNIANLYIYQNDLATAEIYLDSSLKISKEIDAKGILESNYYQYTLLHAIKGDLNNMQIYSNLYSEISNTIINEQSSQQIARMQTIYETEKKEQKIEMLNIENKLKETQLQKRTYWLLIFIIAFVLVLIYIILKRNLLFANKTIVQKNLEIVASEKKLIDINAKGDENISKKINENIAIKYVGSTLTDEQKHNIKSLIINYMNNNKNYLNIDYTENTLAKDLNVNRSYLSQVINELFNKNFTVFLNQYRVKEARKIMSASPNFKYTIESVAELVGYKSKTTFNSAFKKHVGVTPSFYLKTIQREVLSETIE